MSTFKALHLTGLAPDPSKSFSLTATPGTDIWDKPPHTHYFNAPLIYKELNVKDFRGLWATASGVWQDQFDQGGLCIVAHHSDRMCWIKAGIEFFEGEPRASVVVKECYADWSVSSLEVDMRHGARFGITKRDGDESLWVWMLQTDGSKVPLREITWWNTLGSDVSCWAGVYAAKPAPHGESSNLQVSFDGLIVDTV